MVELAEFVRLAKNKELIAQGGEQKKGLLVERFVKLGIDDLVALTAEAYNQEILAADLPWNQGLAKVKNAIKAEGKELEESVALALQNYRDGLIDADDLVAFLLPTRLEERLK